LSSLETKLTIEPDELEALLQEGIPNLSIVNATIKRSKYDPKEDHVTGGRIPGAAYLDFRGFCEPNTQLEYMMPSEAHFTKMMREAINVRKTDKVVIYDKYRNISAPRVWFMMRCFGMQNVWLLNGTYARWEREGRKVEKDQAENALRRVRSDPEQPGDFYFKIDKSRIR
jgi:thiosulfate/3-mercaptopyruvate sulfurtransferase